MSRVLRAVLATYVICIIVAAFCGVGPSGIDAVADEKKADAKKASAKTPEYIGAGKCKKCHLKQHKSWKKTPLALSFESLKPGVKAEEKKAAKLDPKKDYTKDPTCLACHTTAYGTATGYPAVVKDKTWTEAETERATLNEGVTCEACHGPGSLYSVFKKANKEYKLAEIVALGAVSPPTAESCAPCHKKECPTMATDYKFDFEKAKVSDALHKHKKLKYKH